MDDDSDEYSEATRIFAAKVEKEFKESFPLKSERQRRVTPAPRFSYLQSLRTPAKPLDFDQSFTTTMPPSVQLLDLKEEVRNYERKLKVQKQETEDAKEKNAAYENEVSELKKKLLELQTANSMLVEEKRGRELFAPSSAVSGRLESYRQLAKKYHKWLAMKDIQLDVCRQLLDQHGLWTKQTRFQIMRSYRSVELEELNEEEVDTLAQGSEQDFYGIDEWDEDQGEQGEADMSLQEEEGEGEEEEGNEDEEEESLSRAYLEEDTSREEEEEEEGSEVVSSQDVSTDLTESPMKIAGSSAETSFEDREQESEGARTVETVEQTTVRHVSPVLDDSTRLLFAAPPRSRQPSTAGSVHSSLASKATRGRRPSDIVKQEEQEEEEQTFSQGIVGGEEDMAIDESTLMDTSLAVKDDKIIELEYQLSHANDSIALIKAKLSKLPVTEEKLRDLEQQNAILNNALNESMREIAALKEANVRTLTASSPTVSDRAAVRVLQDRCTEQALKLNTQKEELAYRNTKIRGLEQKIGELEAIRTDLQSQLNDERAERKRGTEEKRELERRIDEKERTIRQLRDEVESLKASSSSSLAPSDTTMVLHMQNNPLEMARAEMAEQEKEQARKRSLQEAEGDGPARKMSRADEQRIAELELALRKAEREKEYAAELQMNLAAKYRNITTSLTGLQIKMKNDDILHVISTLDDMTEQPFIIKYDVEREHFDLLDTMDEEVKQRWTNEMETYIGEHGSYPAFFAAVTMRLANERFAMEEDTQAGYNVLAQD